MPYGSLGYGGFTPQGTLAPPPDPNTYRGLQGLIEAFSGGLNSLPDTNAAADVPGAADAVENRAGVTELARVLGGEGSDSNSIAPDPSSGARGGGGQNFVSSEPGAMSFMGFSSGTAFDPQGRMYDTTQFDPGALAGGIVGGLAGPVGGLIGGLAGGLADTSFPISGTRSGPGGFAANVAGNAGNRYSGRQQTAAQEYLAWHRARNPAGAAVQGAYQNARGTPELEAALAQAGASPPVSSTIGGGGGGDQARQHGGSKSAPRSGQRSTSKRGGVSTRR